MNKTEKANQKAEKLIAERKAQIEKINHKIQDEKNKINDFEKEKEDALNSENAGAYHTAKHKIEESQETIEMYNAKLKSFDDVPMVTDSEYQQTITGIMDEMDGLRIQEEKRLVSLVKEMEKIRDESRAAIDEANAVIAKYQNDLHLGRDVRYYPNGGAMDSSLKKYDNEIVIDFVNEVSSNAYYTDTIKPDAGENNPRQE